MNGIRADESLNFYKDFWINEIDPELNDLMIVVHTELRELERIIKSLTNKKSSNDGMKTELLKYTAVK
jgi:hypothetical protein